MPVGDAPQSMSQLAVRVQKAGVPLALAAAAATSFLSQMHLAHMIGWTYALAWLLPTAVVIWEAVSTVRWFGIPDAESWRKVKIGARRQALLAVGTSMLLNSIWHVNDPHATAPLAITLLVSAVPNVVTFFLLHGAMAVPAPEPVAAPVVQELPEEQEPVEQFPEVQRPARRRLKLEERKQQCVDYLREIEAAGGKAEDVTGVELAARYGLGERWWRQVLNDVLNSRSSDGAAPVAA